MRKLAIILLALASGAAHSQESYNTEIEAVKDRILRQLKDPESAQFRDLRAGEHGDQIMVCGEVNAKNSYGGYTGFEGFVFWNDKLTLPGGGQASVTPMERQFVKLLCDMLPPSSATTPNQSP